MTDALAAAATADLDPAANAATPAGSPTALPGELGLAPADAADADPGAKPAVGDAPSPEEEAAARRAAQLQRLLDRMAERTDFPSLKDAIKGVQKIARSDRAHRRALTDEVLGDVALSAKLLRLINTAYYSSVGGGSITTVTRAVALMGFQSVGLLAASLMLFEKLPKGAEGERVRREFATALLAAVIANRFSPPHALQESAYLTAMFHNLGPMLVWLHLPEDAQQVQAALEAQGIAATDVESVERVSRELLAVGYGEFGIEIAQQWGWPPDMVEALRPLPQPDPETGQIEHHQKVRAACTAANQLARELMAAPADGRAEVLARFQAGWGVLMGWEVEHLEALVDAVQQEWTQLQVVMSLPGIGPAVTAGFEPAPPVPGKPAVARPAPAKPGAANAASAASGAKAAGGAAATAAGGAARPKAPAPAARPPARDNPARIGRLTEGLERLGVAAMGEQSAAQVSDEFMAIVAAALDVDRVVLALREPGQALLKGRVGRGRFAAPVLPHFIVPLDPPADLFGLLSTKGADALISNTDDPLIAQRLPAWFGKHVRAPEFLLLPMQRAGRVHGLIYADTPNGSGGLAISERELSLLKSMRNQLMLALTLREAAG